MRLLCTLSFVGVFFFVNSASSDTFDYSNVLAPPVPTANTQFESVIKWCDDSGKIVRYTSADLSYQGHKPCGEIEASRRCDATGQRFIGPSDNAPHGYLDCDGQQRLFIELDRPIEEPIAAPEPSEATFQPAGYTNPRFEDLDALLDGTAQPEPRAKRKKRRGKEKQKKGELKIEDLQQLQQPFGGAGDLNEALGKLLEAFRQ